MFTFHKLTQDQYEKVVQKNQKISDTIFIITDTDNICVYNYKGQLEISDNIFTLLSKFPGLKNIKKSLEKKKKELSKQNTINQIQDIQQKVQKQQPIDLNNFIFKSKKQQKVNFNTIKKEDDIKFIKKLNTNKVATKWFVDKSSLFKFNDKTLSNELGL